MMRREAPRLLSSHDWKPAEAGSKRSRGGAANDFARSRSGERTTTSSTDNKHNGPGERAAEPASRSTLPRPFRPERPSFSGMAQVQRTPGWWQRQRFGPIGLHSLP